MQEPKINDLLNNDTVFNEVNKKFISLQDGHVKQNNVYLRKVIESLMKKMKVADELFAMTYRRIMFGGSYYKGTKVGMPDEFDLDVIIQFNIKYDLTKFTSSLPGFTKVYVGKEYNFRQSEEKAERTFKKLVNYNMYLDQEKFRCWVEGILSKVVRELPKENDKYVLDMNGEEKFNIKVKKSGPAFTLYINVVPKGTEMQVDLVPVLEFAEPLPVQKAKLESHNKKSWYAVPKPFYNNGNVCKESNLYWRLCFYEQEKEILARNGQVKPIIRMIKKLRDNQDWKSIASYYIETVFLHEIAKGNEFQRNVSNTRLFYNMLTKLQECFMERNIPYYWDNDMNLLSKISGEEMKNHRCRLTNIINSIKTNIKDDPLIIAKFILSTQELADLCYSSPSLAEKTRQRMLSEEEMQKTSTNNQQQDVGAWGTIWNISTKLLKDYLRNQRTLDDTEESGGSQTDEEPLMQRHRQINLQTSEHSQTDGALVPMARFEELVERTVFNTVAPERKTSVGTQTVESTLNDSLTLKRLNSLEANVSEMMDMMISLSEKLNRIEMKLDKHNNSNGRKTVYAAY